MGQAGHKPCDALGFLTIVKDERHGLFGGYLILNTAGRPLEFHCTAPVQPNRAQEILYGPTLEDYLYGEHIGQALVARGATATQFLCTDLRPVLALRRLIAQPIALVLPETDTGLPPGGPRYRIDSGHEGAPPMATIRARGCRLAVAGGYDGDLPLLEDSLKAIGNGLDLLEPFERVRAAVAEAQGAGCSTDGR
jgi:hypothetical protein